VADDELEDDEAQIRESMELGEASSENSQDNSFGMCADDDPLTAMAQNSTNKDKGSEIQMGELQNQRNERLEEQRKFEFMKATKYADFY